MLDIIKAKDSLNKFFNSYGNLQNEEGFKLKIIHTYHVAEISKKLAIGLNLNEDNIKLAELIGLLHDIGRFEEYKVLNKFDSNKFDHAEYGVKMLFEDGIIKEFIEDEKYYNIIQKAIYNHNKLKIEENLDEITLLHSKIIRDSDKLDNFRIKRDYKPEEIFIKIVNSKEEFENSRISDKVMESIRNLKCVKIEDRVEPLDYYICILGFMFDLYFKESLEIVKEKGYTNSLIDKFDYKIPDTRIKMEEVRNILTTYINDKVSENNIQ